MKNQSGFSGFAAQMPDSVLITDPDGKITYANPAFENATGYALGEIAGKKPNILKSGKHGEPFYRDLWRTITGGKPWRGQITSKKKDGSLYTEDAVIFPLTDEKGKPAGFAGIWQDVTDRLLAEEKLRKHLQTGKVLNKILKLPLENRTLPEILQSALAEILSVEWFSIETKGAVFLTDEKTNSLKMAANAGLQESTLKTCAAVPAGRCLCGRVLASGKPVFKAHLDGDHETSYEGMADHGHYIIPITSGARIYGVVNVYTKPGHVRSETDINFLSAIADILAGIIRRRKMNEYFSLLNGLHVKAAGMQDNKAAVALMMNNICEMTGWPLGEVWMPDMDRLCLYQASSHCVAGSGIAAFAEERKNLTFRKGTGLPGRAWESGKPVWAQDVTKASSCGIKAAVAIPITVDGEVAAVMNFLTTEAGPEDAEFMGFLTAAAGQMSMIFRHNLLSEQLVQAQKMETVGTLAGGVAHDFNNILGAIFGYTDFLIKGLRDMPQQLSDALEVRRAAEKAALLTKQLLAFSRKKTGAPRIVNLNDVINGFVPMLKNITTENIKLKIIAEKPIPPVKIDPAQFEQVILNLAANARDAMPEGGAITIKTGEADFTEATAPAGLAAGKYAALSLSDTGTGMSEAVKRKIFEPFFTTKPPGKGTGLGLSIVYGIVKQNNARIAVDTVLNKGTTFTIHIPAAADKEPAGAARGPARDSRTKGSETILIAEDDDAFRAVLLRLLKEEGYNALAAANAEEALALAENHSGEIHLMLTDMRMPGKNGAELAVEMLKSRPAIRLLYMTGYTDAEILDKHRIDEEFLFHKPVDYPAMLGKVREMLDK